MYLFRSTQILVKRMPEKCSWQVCYATPFNTVPSTVGMCLETVPMSFTAESYIHSEPNVYAYCKAWGY